MSATATVPQPAPSSVSGLADFTGQLKSRAEEQAAKRTDQQSKTPEASAPAGTDLKKAPVTDKTEGAGKEADPAKAEKAEKPAKTAEQLAEELSNQSKANLRLGKELAAQRKVNQELLDSVKRLEAKFEGKYEEATPEEAQQKAAKQAFDEYVERQNAGRPDIVAEVGEENFRKLVEAEDSKFRQVAVKKPHLARRIMESENPSREAWEVVQEESIFEEFGKDRKSVLAKAKDILREELFKEFEKEKKPEKPHPAPSLRGSRPSGESAANGATHGFTVRNLFRHTA